MSQLLSLALVLGAQASAGAPRLVDQPNLLSNCGVWQGRSMSLNATGEVTSSVPVTKTIAIVNNVWYQINEYTNPDGSTRRLRFVGRPEEGGGIAILSMDRPEVPAHPSIFRPLTPTDGVLRSYDQTTGREVSTEAFSTRGRYRIMTGHSYKWNEDKTEAIAMGGVSITMETRTGAPPDQPPFEFTAADRKRLGF